MAEQVLQKVSYYLDQLFPGIIFALIALMGLFVFFRRYARTNPLGGAGWKAGKVGGGRFARSLGSLPCHPMQRADLLPLGVITAIYAFFALTNLGSLEAPQSFTRFTQDEPSLSIDLGQEYELRQLAYYTGTWHGGYTVQFSDDGISWTSPLELEQRYSNTFQWHFTALDEVLDSARYVFIQAKNTPLEMGELVFYVTDPVSLEPTPLVLSDDQFRLGRDDGMLLFDEQELVVPRNSYLSGTYFDEIYHARTAYEHVIGEFPYEITHPPLGKLIISIGIHLFGMTPFGWRFMGALFGILMLPIIYVFIKNIFGKTVVAVCGTILLAADFMHFTQTRIATIDVYGVFFMLLMYYFMYRYMALGFEAPLRKTLPNLFLSGLFFGIGIACKWTGFYAGAGLLILYALYQVFRGLYYKREGRMFEFWSYLTSTLGYSIFFFIIVPAIIYVASYIPYSAPKNGGVFSWAHLFDEFWRNQSYMLKYHSGVTDTHAYASRWYTWIVDGRPILYFRDYSGDQISAFAAFGNPLVWWGGLAAMVACGAKAILRRSARAAFILVGYLAQLVPWIFITRITFVYHYFPSTIFLVLGLCMVFDHMIKKGQKRPVYALTGASSALFIAFYPATTGWWAPQAYLSNFLRWLPSWPF